jgi:hypothetical protein
MGKKVNGSSKPLADVPSVHPPMFQASTLGNIGKINTKGGF